MKKDPKKDIHLEGIKVFTNYSGIKKTSNN